MAELLAEPIRIERPLTDGQHLVAEQSRFGQVMGDMDNGQGEPVADKGQHPA